MPPLSPEGSRLPSLATKRTVPPAGVNFRAFSVMLKST